MLREQVACDLCGLDDAEHLATKKGFRVVRCRGCELVYVNPRLSVAGLRALYEDDVYQERQVVRVHDEDWRPRAEARLALIERHQPARGALLDVGCSTGWFLSVAHGAGWRATGIDLSRGAVAHNLAEGRDARVATLERHDLAPRSFDVITLFDSIEHMPSPMRSLREAHALLVDGGLLVVTTPNLDGFFPRFTWRMFGRMGLWDHPGPPGHIYQFGKKTLAMALERAGFDIAHVETEAIDLAYTADELENVIVDAIKLRGRRRPDPGLDESLAAGTGTAAPIAGGTGVALGKRVVRRAAKTAAWALAHGIAGPAARLGSGDSLLVIACKR